MDSIFFSHHLLKDQHPKSAEFDPRKFRELGSFRPKDKGYVDKILNQYANKIVPSDLIISLMECIKKDNQIIGQLIIERTKEKLDNPELVRSFLRQAATMNREKIVDSLIETFQDHISSQTVGQVLREATKNGGTGIVKSLLRHFPDQISPKQLTFAISDGVMTNHKEEVKILLDWSDRIPHQYSDSLIREALIQTQISSEIPSMMMKKLNISMNTLNDCLIESTKTSDHPMIDLILEKLESLDSPNIQISKLKFSKEQLDDEALDLIENGSLKNQLNRFALEKSKGMQSTDKEKLHSYVDQLKGEFDHLNYPQKKMLLFHLFGKKFKFTDRDIHIIQPDKDQPKSIFEKLDQWNLDSVDNTSKSSFFKSYGWNRHTINAVLGIKLLNKKYDERMNVVYRSLEHDRSMF